MSGGGRDSQAASFRASSTRTTTQAPRYGAFLLRGLCRSGGRVGTYSAQAMSSDCGAAPRNAATVLRLTPQLRGICRQVSPASCLRCRISAVLRMDNLLCAIGTPFCRKVRWPGYPAPPAIPAHCGHPFRKNPESGHFAPNPVATLDRIAWPLWSEIRSLCQLTFILFPSLEFRAWEFPLRIPATRLANWGMLP